MSRLPGGPRSFIMPRGKYRYLRARSGLTSSSDWFKTLTAALVEGFQGIDKSGQFPYPCPILEALEQVLQQFLKNWKKLGVKMSKKKYKVREQVKFWGFVINTKDDVVKI